MSEEFEQAHEHLEHAAHGHEGKGHTRSAIIIAVMAAALALIEFAAKDAQTNYLTNHIAAGALSLLVQRFPVQCFSCEI